MATKLYLQEHKRLVIEHLLRLSKEDRRMRFGMYANDDYIKDYVEKTWCAIGHRDCWFGSFEYQYPTAWPKINATCHVSLFNDSAEIGCTVEEDRRNSGIGSEMFVRAATWATSRKATTLYMQCLSENKAIQSIAKKHGMTIGTIDRNEKEATIKVVNSYMDAVNDMILDGLSIYDHSLILFPMKNLLTQPKI